MSATELTLNDLARNLVNATNQNQRETKAEDFTQLPGAVSQREEGADSTHAERSQDPSSVDSPDPLYGLYAQEVKESKEAQENDASIAHSMNEQDYSDEDVADDQDSTLVVDQALLNDKIVPGNVDCLEYRLFDPAFRALINRADRIQKMASDLKNLKEILLLNLHVTKLVIQEVYKNENENYDDSPYVYFSGLFCNPGFANQWYEGLLNLFPKTAVHTLEFRDLAPQFHPDRKASPILRHYGPENPIDYCNNLYTLGIRFLDLANTNLASNLPGILTCNRLGELNAFTKTCNWQAICSWIFCLPCNLIMCCCCCNPNTSVCCCNEYGNEDLNALVTQDEHYLMNLGNALKQFPNLRFSFAKITEYMTGISRRLNKAVDLTSLAKAFEDNQFQVICIEDFEVLGSNEWQNWVNESSVAEIWKALCKSNVLVEFRLRNVPLSLLKDTTIQSIGLAIAKSKVRKLEIIYPETNINTTLSKCEVLVKALKASTCLWGISISLASQFEKWEKDLKDNIHLRQRYVKLLEDIQEIIIRNSFQEIMIGDESCEWVPPMIRSSIKRNDSLQLVRQELREYATSKRKSNMPTMLDALEKKESQENASKDVELSPEAQLKADIEEIAELLKAERRGKVDEVLSEMMTPTPPPEIPTPPPVRNLVLHYLGYQQRSPDPSTPSNKFFPMPDFDSTRSLADARDSCPSQKRSLLDGQLVRF